MSEPISSFKQSMIASSVDFVMVLFSEPIFSLTLYYSRPQSVIRRLQVPHLYFSILNPSQIIQRRIFLPSLVNIYGKFTQSFLLKFLVPFHSLEAKRLPNILQLKLKVVNKPSYNWITAYNHNTKNLLTIFLSTCNFASLISSHHTRLFTSFSHNQRISFVFYNYTNLW